MGKSTDLSAAFGKEEPSYCRTRTFSFLLLFFFCLYLPWHKGLGLTKRPHPWSIRIPGASAAAGTQRDPFGFSPPPPHRPAVRSGQSTLNRCGCKGEKGCVCSDLAMI